MIKNLIQTALDKEYLSLRQYNATPILADFSNVVVKKPWGYEYLLYSNPEIEVWSLFIEYQRGTSMHCHPHKKTSLMVIDGRALFSSLNESFELTGLDGITIDPGTFHSSQAISTSGTHILEFETPPMKHDLVRLEDKYGRAHEGYEGAEKMAFEVNRIRFSNADFHRTKMHCSNEICIRPIKNRMDVFEATQHSKHIVGVVLAGVIRSKTGEPLYTPADIISMGPLHVADYLFDGVVMLFINTTTP